LSELLMEDSALQRLLDIANSPSPSSISAPRNNPRLPEEKGLVRDIN